MGQDKTLRNREQENAKRASTQECVGGYNQVDQLAEKITRLEGIINDQRDELLTLYRRLNCFDR